MLFVMGKKNLSLAIKKPVGSREWHMSEEHAASHHHREEMVPTQSGCWCDEVQL